MNFLIAGHIFLRGDALRRKHADDAPDQIDGFIAGKAHYGILRVQRMQSVLLIFFDHLPINCCGADGDAFGLCTYLIKINQ